MCVGTNSTVYTNSMGVQMNNSNFCSETKLFKKKNTAFYQKFNQSIYRCFL